MHYHHPPYYPSLLIHAIFSTNVNCSLSLGQLQVQLALLTYRLPRLTNMWSHLERQAAGARGRSNGGVGLRGTPPTHTPSITSHKLPNNL